MANLPDIPLEHWTGYIQDQFEEKSNALMDTLDFRIKTSSLAEMFPALHPNDNPLLSAYEEQLKQDADEQERRRQEEYQRLEQEREMLLLQQEREQIMQQLAAQEPIPLTPASPNPDLQGADPAMTNPMYRGQVPDEEGRMPGLVKPIYTQPEGEAQQAGDTRQMAGFGKPFDPAEIESSRLSFERSQAARTPPPPMYEAPTPEKGQSFQDYTRQLGSMLHIGNNEPSQGAPEPEPLPRPTEPQPTGLHNFQQQFNQEMEQPQDRPTDPATNKVWEPVHYVAERLTKKSDELGLADIWSQVTRAVDPAEKADATRKAIARTMKLIPDAMTESVQGLERAAGMGRESAVSSENPYGSGKFGPAEREVIKDVLTPVIQRPLAEAAAGALEGRDIPGLRGLGQAIGVEEGARYSPGDVATNIMSGPFKAFDIAQWIGVAGEALENPASPATALLSIPAAGLAAKLGMKSLGRLADPSIDPFDPMRITTASRPVPDVEYRIVNAKSATRGPQFATQDEALDAISSYPESIRGDLRVREVRGDIDPSAPDMAGRYYHGTGGDFTRPDAEKLNPDSLWGPAHYITNEPLVAGTGELALGGKGQRGYAEQGMSDATRGLLNEIEYAKKTIEERADNPDLVARMQERLDTAEARLLEEPDELKYAREDLADLNRPGLNSKNPELRKYYEKRIADLEMQHRTGPNVRPTDVPPGLRLLDVDQLAGRDFARQVQTVVDSMDTEDLGAAARLAGNEDWQNASYYAKSKVKVGDLWHAANQALADAGYAEYASKMVNEGFAKAGWDGIKYYGGRNIPVKDADGNPVHHDALAIFPESLDKIRNATAGTPGGFIEGSGAGTNLARTTRYATSAAYGAASGGAEASQEPGADLGDVARGAAIGAARGVAGRAIRGTGAETPWAANIAKSEWKMGWRPLYENQPRTPVEEMDPSIQAKAWRKLNDFRDATSTLFFDNRTYMNKLQGEARKYLGRDLTYDEMLSEHTRRNTSQAAQVAIQEGLQPAIQKAGPDIDYFKEAITYRDNIAVSHAKSRQVYAQEAAAQTPGVQAAAREVARLERLSKSANAPLDTLAKLDEARDMLDHERAVREGEAWQTGGMAGEGRSFSGDLDVRQSEERLAEIEQTLGPERWANLQSAMDDTQKFVDQYRQQLYDHGVITKETLDALRQYEFYIPTRILDRVNDEGSVAIGQGISLRDTGIHEASVTGTTLEREDPINSLMRLSFDTEARIARNDAFTAFHFLNQETPVFSAQRVQGSAAHAKMTSEGTRSKIVSGFIDGKKVAYEVNDPWTVKSLRFEHEPISSNWVSKSFQKLGTVTKEMITRNPGFIAGQLLLDISGAMIRETSWEGGPTKSGRVFKALMQSYFDPELWKGLYSGRWNGDYAKFLRDGGGMAGFQDMSVKGLTRKQEDLMRKNVFDGFEVKNMADWGRVLKWLGTGEGMQAISSRLDVAPRVAAARLGEERALKAGFDPRSAELKGMIQGRDVTMDFARGGVLGKWMNRFVPFFNIGFQSAATPFRALRENPAGFLGTTLALVGAPIAAAEVWNRSDPARARDYEDIPDYIKARNLIVMMPEGLPFDIGKPGTDEFGGRRPKYFQMPLREFAMFGVLARAATNKAIEAAGGDVRDPATWNQLGHDILVTGSPIAANNAADLTFAGAPVGISTAAQLAINKDLFRGRQIGTERNDVEASNLSKGIAEQLFKAGFDVRPSQIEFLIRDAGSYTGAGALAAADMVTGRQKMTDEGAQGLPLVGSTVKRFYGNATGQRLTEAREGQVGSGTRQTLHQYGLRPDSIAPVPATYKGAALSRAEQTAWQESFNDEFERELAEIQRSSLWQEPDADHEALIRRAATVARARAATQMVDKNPGIERKIELARTTK